MRQACGVRVRTCARACAHVRESVASTLSRTSKLILGRDEIRPAGRSVEFQASYSLNWRRSFPRPGETILWKCSLANVRERGETNEASEPGRLRNLLLRTRNRRYMELTSGPIKFNDRWLGRPRGWSPLGCLSILGTGWCLRFDGDTNLQDCFSSLVFSNQKTSF